MSAQYSHWATRFRATAVLLGRPQFAQFHLCKTEIDAGSLFMTRTHFLRRDRRRELDCLGESVRRKESE